MSNLAHLFARLRGKLPQPGRLVLTAGTLAAGTLLALPLLLSAGEQPAAAPERSVPVKTFTVRAQDADPSRSFPGKVRASKRVNLSFELDGVLVDLPLTEGTLVRKDQLLAKLDPRDHENNLRSAKARFTEARQNFERAQKLLKEGVIPQATFENAQSNFDTAQAQVKILEKALEDTELRAPFDGTVAKRFVQNHQRVSKHEDILSLQNANSIEIVIQVPESIMAETRQKPLQGRLSAVFDAIAGKVFPVRVHEFRVDADSQTQTYEVVLEMPAPQEFNLLPGMTATVTLSNPAETQEQRGKVWWLPEAAVFGNAQTQENFVYCINPADSKLLRKAVRIGSPTARGIPVLSGLKDGDVVVAAGSKYLREGQPVRPLAAERP